MVKKYVIGRDIVQRLEIRFIIDFYGLSQQEARQDYPALFQIVLDKVKPERDQKKRDSYRDKWWIFAEPRSKLRPAIFSIPQYIVTCRTSKHRIFTFLDSDFIPDAKIVAIGLSDAFHLGVLSSRTHVSFAIACGGWLGVGNDSNYNHADCFNKFPFPDCTEKQKSRIRKIAEELEAHRKNRQAKFPDLTLTDMYNILEKVRAIDKGTLSAAEFSPKDKQIHDRGLISILKQLHDDLDAAVFDAYNWPHDLSDDQLLEKLVALNHQRAAEEKKGKIKYLRPDFQTPNAAKHTQTPSLGTTPRQKGKPRDQIPGAPRRTKLPWPKSLADETRAVREILLTAPRAGFTPEDIAAHFDGRTSTGRTDRIIDILENLLALEQARRPDDDHYAPL